MHELKVGELYHPSRTSWPEGGQYNFRGGGHELALFLSSPSNEEKEAIVSGTAEFGLLVKQEALFLLYEFGDGLPWSDAPYQWWLVPAEQRTLPNPEPTDLERALLTVILVDADTGKIAANIRAVTFSPEFSAALHKAIRQQARTAWEGPAKYDQALAKIYARYPTTEDMVAATDARCTGGD